MWHEFKIKSGHTLTIYAFIKIDKNIKWKKTNKQTNKQTNLPQRSIRVDVRVFIHQPKGGFRPLQHRSYGYTHRRKLITAFPIERFSYDLTAVILVYQKQWTAAILVYQSSPVGVEVFSYVNTFFCFNKFT